MAGAGAPQSDLARFEKFERIGSGGFGEVFRGCVPVEYGCNEPMHVHVVDNTGTVRSNVAPEFDIPI